MSITKYEDLTTYQKKTLPATNFWRIANGLEPIKVPKSDKSYYQYSTPAQEAKAKQIFNDKVRLDSL